MTTTPHIDTHLDLKGLEAMADYIGKKMPEVKATMAVRELALEVEPAQLQELVKFLRDDRKLQFTQLIDICGVDFMGSKHAHPARFAVVYHLLSMAQNQRVRVKTYVPESHPEVPTLTGLFAAAGWYERETYDMFGIAFTGHPDLRRILTDYDFEGFPLRKDFPLEGHVEVYYDAKEKRVAYKPVDLPQEFRHFDKVSEWSGLTGNKGLAETDNVFNSEEFK